MGDCDAPRAHGSMCVDGHCRWCSECKTAHGVWFPCEAYSAELRTQMRAEAEVCRRTLSRRFRELDGDLPYPQMIMLILLGGLVKEEASN